jgi:hypothetical protein
VGFAGSAVARILLGLRRGKNPGKKWLLSVPLSQLWQAISVGEELLDARALQYVPHPLIHAG